MRKLLGGITGTNGFAQRIQGILDPVSGTNGVLSQRISSEDSTLSSIANDLIRFDKRMTAKQDALSKQWSALETALQKAQSRASDISGLSIELVARADERPAASSAAGRGRSTG